MLYTEVPDVPSRADGNSYADTPAQIYKYAANLYTLDYAYKEGKGKQLRSFALVVALSYFSRTEEDQYGAYSASNLYYKDNE
jgi:hypothetical protein